MRFAVGGVVLLCVCTLCACTAQLCCCPICLPGREVPSLLKPRCRLLCCREGKRCIA